MTRLDNFQTRHDVIAVPVTGLVIVTLATAGGALAGWLVHLLGSL